MQTSDASWADFALIRNAAKPKKHQHATRSIVLCERRRVSPPSAFLGFASTEKDSVWGDSNALHSTCAHNTRRLLLTAVNRVEISCPWQLFTLTIPKPKVYFLGLHQCANMMMYMYYMYVMWRNGMWPPRSISRMTQDAKHRSNHVLFQTKSIRDSTWCCS